VRNNKPGKVKINISVRRSIIVSPNSASRFFFYIFVLFKYGKHTRQHKIKQCGVLAFEGTLTPNFNFLTILYRSAFLLNKTNRCTKFQIYWYYNSTCFGQSFCPSSGVLAVHRRWYSLCSFGDWMLPSAVALGSTQPPKLHKLYQCRCTARTPDDGQKDCPKHAEL
jgi:hypothetical protein